MSDVIDLPRTSQQSSVEDMLLQYEIEQFLYHEAALLDDRKYWEWYDLLDDDLEYWMPVRTTTARGDEANEFAKPGEGAFFDETKPLFGERLRKLDTAYSWSEDPPSRVRHFVSNVRVEEKISDNEYRVWVNFYVYRSRLARDEDTWVGKREDIVRRTADGWKLARRHIFIDQVSIQSKNISIFL